MNYEFDLKQYKSLERRLEHEDVNACFEAATFFDSLLDTYNKSAGQVFDDLEELKINNVRVKTTPFGDRISMYDVSMMGKVLRRARREAVQQQTTSTSPYDLGALARARRKRQAERSTRIVTRGSPYNLGRS